METPRDAMTVLVRNESQKLTAIFVNTCGTTMVAIGVLGPVDKVDSQISGSVIQDYLLGGGSGSRRPHGYGMADHRGVIAYRTR